MNEANLDIYIYLKPTVWVDQSAMQFGIHRIADQGGGNAHIIQDVIRAIQVSPGRSFAMNFAIDRI